MCIRDREGFLHAVRRAPFPVIAAVEGGVWGGACEFVLTCDLIVAVRTATFAITPARLGVPYNTAGVAHVLGAVPLNVAKEMFFTAEAISAQAIQDGVRHYGGERLREVRLFDVYRGKGVAEGRKSLALGLILQDFSHNLTDSVVEETVSGIIAGLSGQFGATLRI